MGTSKIDHAVAVQRLRQPCAGEADAGSVANTVKRTLQGVSDPYVAVTVPFGLEKPHSWKSSVANDELNPIWNVVDRFKMNLELDYI